MSRSPSSAPAPFTAHTTEWAGPSGRIRVAEPAPGVFVSEVHGRASIGVVGVIIRFAEEMIAADRRLLVFHDWEDVSGYDAEARRQLTEWTDRIKPYWDGSHILFASPIVAMAVSVAGLTMRGKLSSYSSRKSWEHALAKACAARGAISPNRD
jgi:hypothetical protein